VKISKQRIKEIIREEFEKAKATDTKVASRELGKQQATGGVTDNERGIIKKLQNQLVAAAKLDAINKGPVLRFAQKLSDELTKIISKSKESEEEKTEI
tara:strand:- start:1371 stop:1664 length:294 start_codon:yes stop_codon:yes gene_type:complete